MSTSTTVNNLKINKLTKAQYDDIQSPSETELYLVEESIDSTPTSGSENPVSSGGVYTALSGKEDKVDIVSASGATLTAEVGKYYTLSNVGTLAITLPTIASGTTKVQTVTFYIAAGSTPAVTFTSTHQVVKSDGFVIEANGVYEVCAAWNGVGWFITQVKFDYEPPIVNIKTKSTGSMDASITVTKDGVETDIVYTSVQSGNYWDNGIIKVMYNPTGYTGWAVFAETTVYYNSVEYSDGDAVNNWAYNSNVDFDVYY